MLVELEFHGFLEILGVLSASLINFVDHTDKHFEPLGCFCFFNVVPCGFHAFQRDSFASSGYVREYAVLDWIVL